MLIDSGYILIDSNHKFYFTFIKKPNYIGILFPKLIEGCMKSKNYPIKKFLEKIYKNSFFTKK